MFVSADGVNSGRHKNVERVKSGSFTQKWEDINRLNGTTDGRGRGGDSRKRAVLQVVHKSLNGTLGQVPVRVRCSTDGVKEGGPHKRWLDLDNLWPSYEDLNSSLGLFMAIITP